MSRDGYLPPGVEQEDIDRYYNGEEFDARRDDPEPPDDNYREEAFERELRRADQAAEDARYFAAHPEPKEAPPLKPEPEYIAGIPFGPDPKNPTLSDLAQCLLCMEVVDVGGEMRDHIARHEDARLEAYL